MAKIKRKLVKKVAPVKKSLKVAPKNNPAKDVEMKKDNSPSFKDVKILKGAELIAKQNKAKADKKKELVSKVIKKERKKYTLSDLMLLYAVAVDPTNIYVVNLSFINFNHPNFFEFVNNVLASLNDNDFYPDPSPALSIILEQIGYYKKAKADKKTEAANEFYANIQYLMKQLAIYVANNCGNLLSTLIDSGFIANKLKRGASKNMTQVKIRSAKITKQARICEATYDEVLGAALYNGKWCLRDVEDAPMNHVAGSTGVRMEFDELPIEEWILLFVRAIGPKGKGDWSDGFPFFPK